MFSEFKQLCCHELLQLFSLPALSTFSIIIGFPIFPAMPSNSLSYDIKVLHSAEQSKGSSILDMQYFVDIFCFHLK